MDRPVLLLSTVSSASMSVCTLKLKDFSRRERKNPRSMRHKCAESRGCVGKKDRIGTAAAAAYIRSFATCRCSNESGTFAQVTSRRQRAPTVAVMSNYTDDARKDGSVSHDSSRADIFVSNVLSASASSPAVDDLRRVGQPSSAGCDRLPPGRESRPQGTPGRAPHSASPTPNADGSLEKRTRSVAKY